MSASDADASDPEVARLAIALQQATSKLLTETMEIRADLSKALFYDVALHWKGDVDRIRKVDVKGIRPAKHVAYLAFWIRKIKPVSNAYSAALHQEHRKAGRPMPSSAEIVNINERVAIRLAFQQLGSFAQAGQLFIHHDAKGEDIRIDYDETRFVTALERYCHQKLALDGKCVLETLLSDMRYRTFGPHHLVHIFDQFVFNLSPAMHSA